MPTNLHPLCPFLTLLMELFSNRAFVGLEDNVKKQLELNLELLYSKLITSSNKFYSLGGYCLKVSTIYIQGRNQKFFMAREVLAKKGTIYARYYSYIISVVYNTLISVKKLGGITIRLLWLNCWYVFLDIHLHIE